MSTSTNNSKGRVILVIVLAIFVLILGAIAIYIHNIYIPLDSSKLSNISPCVVILDGNGNQIDESLLINNSHYINIDSLPQHTIDAFVCVEDKRFFEHNGLDYRRIAGAIVNNIKAGSFKEGASTITQQLIKNTHLDNDKTINRKISEQMLAIQLEQQYTKLEILEMYLNTIYFGCNAYGIESASLCYFDKSAKQLTLAESATLAGMIKAPNSYNPNDDVDRCTTRRNLVLQLMLEQDAITQQQYDSAVSTAVACKPSTSNDYGYMYGVVQEACQILNMTPSQLANSSLTITTYYDSYAQQCLDNALYADMYSIDNASATAVMCNNSNCGIIAVSSYGRYMANSSRQVGSTIKPIAVYAPAIDMGMLDAASLILDEKINFGGYTPSNYNSKYHGWVTATDALAQSMNVPSVKILNSIGVANSCQHLNNMGVDATDQDLSMALGNVTTGMDIYQLAQCYATLANNGRYNKASYIASIDNKSGNVYTNSTTSTQVFGADTAYIATNMLQYTVSNGTASRLKTLPYDIACKTGTVGSSCSNTDALSCAYTCNNTIISWISGQLDNSITGGTVPTQIIADTLERYYTTYPDNFAVPDNISLVTVDTVELENNQRVLLAGSHTKPSQQRSFPFVTSTAPTEYSKQNPLPTLDVSMADNTISVDIDCDMDIEVHRICDDCDTVIGYTNHVTDSDILPGNSYRYYALLTSHGKHIANTPIATIVVPLEDYQLDSHFEPDIVDTPSTLPLIDNDDTSKHIGNKHNSILDIFYIGKGK